MFTLDLDKLTPEQRSMVALWEEHIKAEFQDKDARASCDTMVANPYSQPRAGADRRSRPASVAELLRTVLHPRPAAQRGDRAHLADRRPESHRG